MSSMCPTGYDPTGTPPAHGYPADPRARVRPGVLESVVAGPGDEIVRGPGVDDAVGRHAAQRRTDAAIVEPVQLSRCVGVGVDREPAAGLERLAQQPLRRVEAIGPAVDFDGLVMVDARREYGRRVEGTLRSGTAGTVPAITLARRGHLATGAVAEDVEPRIAYGRQHAPRHHVRVVAQTAVHRADDDVEPVEQLTFLIERTVGVDVDLDAGQDPKAVGQLAVDGPDEFELLAQSIGGQTACDGQARRMIGEPPSDQSECRWQSPRNVSRRACAASPTSLPSVACRRRKYTGTSPASDSAMHLAVTSPTPGRSASVPAFARAASSAGSVPVTVFAALRNDRTRNVDSFARSSRNAICRRSAAGSRLPLSALVMSEESTRRCRALGFGVREKVVVRRRPGVGHRR